MQDKRGLHSLCSELGSLQGQIFCPSLLSRELVTALPFEEKPHSWRSSARAGRRVGEEHLLGTGSAVWSDISCGAWIRATALLPPPFGLTSHLPIRRPSFEWQPPIQDELLCRSDGSQAWIVKAGSGPVQPPSLPWCCLHARVCCLCCHLALMSRRRGCGLKHACLCIGYMAAGEEELGGCRASELTVMEHHVRVTTSHERGIGPMSLRKSCGSDSAHA